MRLHRLSLTNYRGIAHREIEFAESGVTVVCGANEVGKSSMIEALDLLLESKDRSTKRDVKQVKPTHADVGSEVTAEISTGPYRFVYRKRFHKKCETELTVLAPARAQLTGDEAHDRVRAMLDATVDTGLWQAQRVLQAASTSAVDLSGCDALSRALDVAASDSAAALSGGLSGSEPLLIEKIDAEYARYFTATGRPTGEWAVAINALKAADADVAHCAAEVAEVDERVRQHAVLTEELADLAAQRDSVDKRHASAESAAKAMAALTDELRAARAEAGTLSANSATAAAARQERRRLCVEVEQRGAAALTAKAAAAEAAESEETGQAVVTAAELAAEASAEQLAVTERRVRAAEVVVAKLAQHAQAERIAARVNRFDAANTELDGVTSQLALITMTDALCRRIETAAAALDRAQVHADVVSAALQFTAESDIELVLGADTIALKAGQSWTLTAAQATEVRLPGQLSLLVTPGASAVETHAKLAAAQADLAESLAAGGVADVEEARRTEAQRRELVARRDQLAATLTGITGDDDIATLRSRLAALRADDQPVDLDADAAHAELAAANSERAAAVAQSETDRKVAAAAARQLVERSTAAKVSQDRVAMASKELATVTDRLVTSRTEESDENLQARADAAAEAARAAEVRADDLSASLAQAGPEAVTAELAVARSAAEALRRSHDEAAQLLRDVAVELSVFGTQGRTGKLDAAQIKREHAVANHARVQRRARAVELLRTVMTRHRDDTRLRYVEPFRAEVERLGRTVFGPTFEVEVDSELRICNRTLDGRTVPFESLSGGAKEQLGIVARLAVAALVADEDTVPVVIDDALGFSDPDRLAKMGAVFDQVGADGQVIVLTCSPERYNGVAGAHRVQLTA